MANTKNSQNKTNKTNKTNKSGKPQSSGKNTGKKKSSSDDTMKFLLVLVIAGIAIALIFFSQSKDKPAENNLTGTPTPTTEAGTLTDNTTPEPTGTGQTQENTNRDITPVPTEGAAAPEATVAPTAAVKPTGTPTPAATNTPTPTPALSAAEAEKIVKAVVDTAVYNVQLVSEKLQVGNDRYYQFGAIANQEFVYPFLVVSQTDGKLHYYDSTEDTVFDFTKFPLRAEATPTPVPTPEQKKNLTAEEAYKVLCTYSKEALQTRKEVSEYQVEYGDELTLINGVDCYRFNLSEVSDGKVRNRGEFYISVDGTKCYYMDNTMNEFIQVVK